MPCTMPTIEFNRTDENVELKRVGDELTHALDLIREGLLSGGTPDFSQDSENWTEVISRSIQSWKVESTGPSSGVLTDEALLAQVRELYFRYNSIKAAWRGDRCADMMEELEQEQISHREEDLKRLAHTFIDNGDKERLIAVIKADPNEPLTPQLGFDPDDF